MDAAARRCRRHARGPGRPARRVHCIIILASVHSRCCCRGNPVASTSGTNAASPRARSSDACGGRARLCELAKDEGFRLAGAVRERLLARDELLSRLPVGAARPPPRRGELGGGPCRPITTPVQLPASRKANTGAAPSEEQPSAEAAARRARPGTTAPLSSPRDCLGSLTPRDDAAPRPDQQWGPFRTGGIAARVARLAGRGVRARPPTQHRFHRVLRARAVADARAPSQQRTAAFV